MHFRCMYMLQPLLVRALKQADGQGLWANTLGLQLKSKEQPCYYKIHKINLNPSLALLQLFLHSPMK